MRKLIGLMTIFCLTVGLLQGTAFAEGYDYVSLGYADSVYVKTQDTTPRRLRVVGVIEGDYATQGQYVDLTGQTGLSYTSSNEAVADVDATGFLTIHDYGITTVTVTDGKTTASMLVTVTAEGYLGDGAGKTLFDSDSGYAFNDKVVRETELVRRGDGAVKAAEGVTGAVTYNTLSNRWAPAAGSSIMAEIWVYDPGKTDAGIWTAGSRFNIMDNCASDIINAWGRPDLTIGGDTGIGEFGPVYNIPRYRVGQNDTAAPQRTKGWHQFVMILYNDGTIGEEKMSDGKVIDQIRLANNFRLFVDGQEVEIERLPKDALRSVAAGFKINCTQWPVDDASQRRYIELKNAKVSGNAMVGETLTASYQYINTMELNRQDEIKWYRADSANADDWGAAIGTGESYTLTEADAGKYIKAEISVTATETNASTRVTEKTTTSNRSAVTATPVAGEDATITLAYDSADGSVTAQGLTNNQITVPYGNAVTFTVTPAAGKRFQKAVFGDVIINSLSAENSFTLENIMASGTLSIAFEDIPQTEPQLAAGASSLATDPAYQPKDELGNPQGDPVKSAVLFAKFSAGYGYNVEYGVKVELPDGSSLHLPGVTDLDGKYGVRVYGLPLDEVEYYILTPYIRYGLPGQPLGDYLYGTPCRVENS